MRLMNRLGIAATATLMSACSFGIDGIEDFADGLVCGFLEGTGLGYGEELQEGVEGNARVFARAPLTATPEVVAAGARVTVVLQVETDKVINAEDVEADVEGDLTLRSTETESCDYSSSEGTLTATVSARVDGPGSFVIREDEDELGRFTPEVRTPVSLDIVTEGACTVGDSCSLTAVISDEGGAALYAEEDIEWTLLEGKTSVGLGPSVRAFGSSAAIATEQSGTLLVRVRALGFEQNIQIAITNGGHRRAFAADGYVGP